jgi:RNA polymerase sigma-70 factor (ECF subfamily)
MPDDDVTSAAVDRRHFATTHWSIVREAGHRSTPEAAAALETLCQAYWFPLYAFVRRQGHREAEAQDLTQSFFVKLLERDDLRHLTPEKGRFRSFLLASLKHFLLNEWDRTKAQKRGGGRIILSLDFAAAESRLNVEPIDRVTPQSIFERQWAVTLLDRVRTLLREEFLAEDRGEQFDVLYIHLTGDSSGLSYAEAAARLSMTEAAVKMAVHRLRRRFRDAIRREIAQTVATPEDVDDEIHTLMAALQRTV